MTGPRPQSARGAQDPRKPVRMQSLTSQVESLIAEMCMAPGVNPGDELPSEGQLVDLFGVSRAVVREAMRAAEAQGLVRTRQGKPAVISEPNAQPVEDFAVRSVLRDKRSALELTEVRKALEVHAARLAALRVRQDEAATAPDVAAARGALDALRSCPQDAAERAARDLAFHHALAGIGGNAILAQVLAALDRALHDSREEHHRAAMRRGQEPSVLVTEHGEVLQAVLSGDPRRAISAMESHLDMSLREIERRVPAEGGSAEEGSAPGDSAPGAGEKVTS